MTVFLRGQAAGEWNEKGQKYNVVGKPRGKYLARKLGHAVYSLES